MTLSLNFVWSPDSLEVSRSLLRPSTMKRAEHSLKPLVRYFDKKYCKYSKFVHFELYFRPKTHCLRQSEGHQTWNRKIQTYSHWLSRACRRHHLFLWSQRSSTGKLNKYTLIKLILSWNVGNFCSGFVSSTIYKTSWSGRRWCDRLWRRTKRTGKKA